MLALRLSHFSPQHTSPAQKASGRGHVAATPQRRVMNVRRSIVTVTFWPRWGRLMPEGKIARFNGGLCEQRQTRGTTSCRATEVRFGSIASISPCSRNVRFITHIDRRADMPSPPLRGRTGHRFLSFGRSFRNSSLVPPYHLGGHQSTLLHAQAVACPKPFRKPVEKRHESSFHFRYGSSAC
jgi:hypothetical protein